MRRLFTMLSLAALAAGMLATPAGAAGKQEQAITLIDLPASFAVDEYTLVQAHVTSGLPLRFEVQTDACAPKGYSPTYVDVIGVDPGACRVRISQAGDAQWASVEKTVNVTVTKAIGGALTATGVHTDDPLAPLDHATSHFAPGEAIDVVIYEVNPDYDPGASPEITGDIVYSVDGVDETTAPLRRVSRPDGTAHNVVTFTIPAESLARGNDHTIFARYLGSAHYEPNKIAQHAFEVNLVATVSVSALPEHPTVGDEVLVTVNVGLRDQPTPPVPEGKVSVNADDTDLGDHDLVNGRVQFATTKLPGGAVGIEAIYNGDNAHGITGADGELLVEIDPANSRSAVVGPSGAFVGDDATFTLAVAGAGGGPVPTGKFELTREPLGAGDGVVVGEYSLGGDGTVEVTLPGDLPAEAYLYFGRYEGDESYLASSAAVHPFRVVKHEQEITFPPPEDLTVGGDEVLSATSDSGLPVTYVSQTTATCAVIPVPGGSAIHAVSSGSCAVTAQQPGNDRYDAADDVTRFASVAKREQRIAFPAVPTLAVGQKVTLRASATSELPVRYHSETPATCTISGSSVVGRAQGACEITAAQPGDDQWQVAGQKARATFVFKRKQAITFLPPSRGLVGATVPVPVRASSRLPVTVRSSTPVVCTWATGAVTLRAAGPCRLTASQSGDGTWGPATAVTRTMTVVKRTQRITFPRPANGTVSGKRTLRATASSGLPPRYRVATPALCTATGATLRLRAPGVCTITALQPGNGSYAAADPVTVRLRIRS